MFITPAVAGETLYIGSCSGRLFALDAATGAERWTYDTGADGSPASFHGDMLIEGDRLFVGTDTEPVGHLYAFDLPSGRRLWKIGFPGGVPSQVLGRGETLFAQAANGEVWAVERATGEPLWTHRAASPVPQGQPQVDPVLAGDRLVVAWGSGDVEALDPATGELAWRFAAGQRPNTSVVALGSHVLVGTADLPTMQGRLHRLALADGAAAPPIELGALPFGDLVLTDRCLLLLTMRDGHRVACRDRDDPTKTLWERVFKPELTTFRPLPWRDEVVVGHRGALVGLRLADGVDGWTCEVDGAPRGLNATAEHLYVGMLGGAVLALPTPAVESCRASPPSAAAR